MFISVRDLKVLASLELSETRMLIDLHRRVETTIGLLSSDFDIWFRLG